MTPRQDFEIFWSRLQREISAGDTVLNWTEPKGYLGDSFTIRSVDSEVIVVDTPNARKPPRVYKKDFEKIYDFWDVYNKGYLRRKALRDIPSFKLKYIFSILNHLLNDR